MLWMTTRLLQNISQNSLLLILTRQKFAALKKRDIRAYARSVFLQCCRCVAVPWFTMKTVNKWKRSHVVLQQKSDAENASSSSLRGNTLLQIEARFLLKYRIRLMFSRLMRVWRVF